MKNVVQFVSVSALALIVATPLLAQGTIIGSTALNDRIEAIEDDVNTDMARGEDDVRFGPMDVVQGWNGSLALIASATSGNTDSGEISAAGRLTYGSGPYVHTFAFAAEYGEANGIQSEEKIFGTYEGSRYFTPKFYAYGVGRYEYDGFATNEHDAFLGVGAGYRLVNTDQMTWRVQAGPGARYVKDQFGVDTTDAGLLASSRFFYKLTDTIALTNDTDVLTSDFNTVVSNDFGVNFKVTNNLSTRVSYRTDYNSDPLPGFTNTDNTVGLALVVGF